MANSVPQLRDDAEGRNNRAPSSMRQPLAPDLSGLQSDTRKRVGAIVDKMNARAAKNAANFREDHGGHDEHGDKAAGHGAEHDDHGHGGHAAPKSKKPAIPKLTSETVADLMDTANTLIRFRKKWRTGEVIQEDVAQVYNDVLDTLGLDVLRQGTMVYAYLTSKMLGIPSHPIHKIAPNYTDLGGQILGFHPDEDDPNSYHHSVEGLMSQVNELDLQRHFSILRSPTKLTQALSSMKGQTKAKEQFDKLFGPDITDHNEFLTTSQQILERLGCTITPAGSTNPAHIHIHDLRHRHANHSLHAFVALVGAARQNITAERLAKISEPVEDIKLDKDMNHFGNILMEHVKASGALSAQFLGNVDINVFNKTFRLLLDTPALEVALNEEPEEVKKQLYELFNLSGHVNAAEINSFTDGLIGPAPYPPAAGATPARPGPGVLPPDVNGGALGMRNLHIDNASALRKFDQLRQSIHEARLRLTTAPIVGDPTPLQQLFPAKAETIKYNEFGIQLGRSVRGKNGANRARARAAWLRGLDVPAFDDHFLILTDNTALAAAVAGSKADKDNVKARIQELTGLNVTNVTPAIFQRKMNDIRAALADGTAPDVLDPVTQANLIAKRAAFLAVLGQPPVAAGTLQHNVEAVLDQLYQEESLERNLGTTLLRATASNLQSIISKIDRSFLILNYGHLNAQCPAAPATPVFPADLITYKLQLARFIGANNTFLWNDTNVLEILRQLREQANEADRLFGGSVSSRTAALRDMITRIESFNGQIFPGSTRTFFEHLQTI